ncbi:MAG: ATP-binding protein [Pseudomonadota bacterium]
MILPVLDKFAFGERLNQLVSPAAPVRSIEHLLGRTKELDRIEKALMLDGRNIFIYGDRGVGKSSLAATAAAQYQSSEAEPIQVACSPDATFGTVIANIAYEAIKASRITKTKQQFKTSLELRYLKQDASIEITQNDIRAEIQSVVDAVNGLDPFPRTV